MFSYGRLMWNTRMMVHAALWALLLLLITDEAQAQGNNGGLSGLGIGLIVAGIVIFIIVIVIAGICCFGYKRKHLGHLELEHPDYEHSTEPYYRTSSMSHDQEVEEPIHYDTTDEAAADRIEASESDGDATSTDGVITSPGKAGRKEKFDQQLLELQHHKATLHEMLTDVQERIKNAKHGNPRVQGYKAVSRDLSRVQHLLNKSSSSTVKMPPDGVELLTWVAEAKNKYLELQRYKSRKDSGASAEPPEMASIMWIQSKDDSAFEDKLFDERAV